MQVAEDNKPESIYAWYVVAVLALAYTISFADRQILSLLVTPLKADLGLTDTEISLLQGLSFSVFYLGAAIPIAKLADRSNRKRIIIVGMVIWCSMTVFCGFATSYTELFIGRMGVGLGEAALTPAALSIISDYFPPRRLPVATTAYSLALSVGAGTAYIAGGSIVGSVGDLEIANAFLPSNLANWQVALIVVGFIGFIAVPLVATIKEPERKIRSDQQLPSATMTAFVKFLRTNIAFYSCFFGALSLVVSVTVAMLSWTPALFQRSHGFTIEQVGLAFGTSLLTAGIIGPIVGAAAAMRLRQRGYVDAELRVIRFAAAACLPFMCVWPLAENGFVAVAFLGVANFFTSMATTGLAAAVLQIVTPHPVRAQTTALFFLTTSLIGLFVGPTSVAMLTDYVFSNDQALGKSLAVISTTTLVPAIILLSFSMSLLRRMMDRENAAL